MYTIFFDKKNMQAVRYLRGCRGRGNTPSATYSSAKENRYPIFFKAQNWFILDTFCTLKCLKKTQFCVSKSMFRLVLKSLPTVAYSTIWGMNADWWKQVLKEVWKFLKAKKNLQFIGPFFSWLCDRTCRVP